MMEISQIAAAKIQELPPEKQQEVLDFIEFLQFKMRLPQTEKPVSFLEAAREFVGCLNNDLTDLSYNNQHMEGYGE
ncbi:DUF2281 domain-containing protein [Nostoc sp. UIC 10607]|uniref:DUF2281 domain-containing protein n=1 Tax=Nostoc sp. UIC 10607 TaxID=3045935 RepID=UPI00399EF0CC